ncbi:MAG TPA: ATP-binding protein [Cytophagaceae bacterium]
MSHNLKIACTKNNLKDIRDFVNSTLRKLCIPELEINMIVLAVDEICANRIIHSNNCDKEQHLEVKIRDENQGVSFEIVDEGEIFDHSDYVEPSLDQLVREKRKGGLGLMLVKRIMDSIEVKKENDYTVCRLFKKINVC